MALVPFYAVFGISVFSARLMTIAFMLTAAIIWFKLILSLYDSKVAVYSSLLLITTPSIVVLSRVIMSEIPALATIILAVYFLHHYCKREEKKYMIGFAFAAVLGHDRYGRYPDCPAYLFRFWYCLGRQPGSTACPVDRPAGGHGGSPAGPTYSY